MKWEGIKIERLCNLVRGSSPRPQGDERYYGGPVPRLMIEDITRDGMYVIPKTDSLTELGATMSRPMKAGDLVMTVSGRTGVPAILKIDACIHDGFVGFRDLSPSVNTEYLYYYLSHLTEKTNSRSVGAIFKNLTTNQVKNIVVPLPPLHIQEQIADTLDKADALRRKDQELLQKYDQLAQAIFYDMFGDPVRNERGWDITRGKDTFIFSSGKFNPTKNLHNSFPYPTYGGNGITGFSKEKLIEYSTIVIGRVGAYCGSVHLTEKESWITDNAIYLKSGFQDFDMTFLLFLFKKLNLNQFADYSGQPKITQKPLEELGYIKPPQVLQKKFGQLVQNINSTKNMLSKAYSGGLNQNLLFRYFS
jgi:restriction endonuclease S subunit